jgi:arylsulfatase A-like enzyme
VRAPWSLAGALGCLIAVGPACLLLPPEPPSLNLLLITLDTTRADHLGAYGSTTGLTPNLDRLAAEGITFEQTESAAPLTLPAHEAILTGRFPPEDRAVDNAIQFESTAPTLAERLHARGFRTGAFVSSYVLHSRWGLNRGFDAYDAPTGDGQGPDRFRRSGDLVADQAIDWIAGAPASRFFAWVHFYDAHARYAPDGRTASPDGREAYCEGIRKADVQVGRIVDTLKQLALLDRTLLVVVADHGESLGEHGEAGHGVFLYEAVTHVPLIVRIPYGRLAGSRVGGVTRTVDILPTALSLLGIHPPFDPRIADRIDGADLTPYLGRRREVELDARSATDYPQRHYGWSSLRAIRNGRFKAIEAPRPELYDLERDPYELHDVLNDRPALARALLNRLHDAASNRTTAIDSLDPARSSDEGRRALASLGYAMGTVGAPSVAGGLPDPKDRIHLITTAGHGLERRTP